VVVVVVVVVVVASNDYGKEAKSEKEETVLSLTFKTYYHFISSENVKFQ